MIDITEKEIFKEFEAEKGYDPHTTSDCELTNWLVKKLIESRRENKERHKDEIIHAFQSGSDNGVTMRSIEAGEEFYKNTYEKEN